MTDIKLLEGQTITNALFGIHLFDIIEENPNIKIIAADTSSYIPALELFKAMYPDSFINAGISEQNMIGIAAGLTSEGFRCVCLAQACFLTMRCFEQVRQYMSYMGIPIILVGLSAGFGLQFMGNTHYAIEDISLLRSIPGINIFSPSDAIQAIKIFDMALTLDSPSYIRLTGNTPSLLYSNDFDYDMHLSTPIKEGQDIIVFATGSMVHQLNEIAEKVESTTGNSVACYDVHCLQPFDIKALECVKKAKLIVSLEEHGINGGLGSIISDYVAQNPGFPPILKLGINGYSTVGDYNYLLQQHGLTAPQIAEKIIQSVR